VVLHSSSDGDQLRGCEQIIASVPRSMQADAPLESVVVVPALAKANSGKILRRTMSGIADCRPEPVTSTIADVRVLDDISPSLRGCATRAG
jgi:acyl-coenzyme A synthetase/AMP-(fatty) acid ligase